DVDRFDNHFFCISPREADLMDPQQRLFLEVAWAAIEDAGHTPGTLGDDTGVFVGACASDYALYANPAAMVDREGAYRNADLFQIANRVSFHFDFHGPSITIDTACSASGTALHLACTSLERGECRAALVGGVNLYLHPSRFVQYAQMQILSPDGICRPFGAGANGTVFGEGIAAVVLKPLRAARADGDHVYAVIRATACNAGGRTSGFTVPNPHAHRALVSQALRRAAIDARTVSYVEAHGTGTELGDPIEVRGLSMAFAENSHLAGHRADTRYCALGSIKANLGHLEAAAGLVGVIKVLLQLEHRRLVPSLHAEPSNPLIPFASSPFQLQGSERPWERPRLIIDGVETSVPRRAGVSSFGAGGTNAHAILEEAPPHEREPGGAEVVVLAVSARTDQGLAARVAELHAYLVHQLALPSGERVELADVAHTLRVGREAMACRMAIIAGDLAQAAARLDDFIAGRSQASEPAIDARSAAADLAMRARRWVAGGGLDDLPAPAAPLRRVRLPTYPFRGQRRWLGSAGRAAPPTGSEPALDVARFRLSEHVIDGVAMLPGVAALALMVDAVRPFERGPLRLDDVVWTAAVRGSQPTLAVRVATDSADGGAWAIEIEQLGAEPTPCVRGRIRRLADSSPTPHRDLDAIRRRCTERIEGSALYQRFSQLGLA
ncbi:MAG TPA: beta-ketoacyl synthase N-terminal-like domain-containing protein, partial [Kofleriaceae bacterium]|nr:beta-ketoacyl synthase N-terminal-like domain-containing protein [Kofleriaceae bacterium]